MEKGPEIRIVGRASAEKKEQVEKEIELAFFVILNLFHRKSKNNLKSLNIRNLKKSLLSFNSQTKKHLD